MGDLSDQNAVRDFAHPKWHFSRRRGTPWSIFLPPSKLQVAEKRGAPDGAMEKLDSQTAEEQKGAGSDHEDMSRQVSWGENKSKGRTKTGPGGN